MNRQRHYALEIAAQGKSVALQPTLLVKKNLSTFVQNPESGIHGQIFLVVFTNRITRLQCQGNFYKRSQIGGANNKSPTRQWTASIRERSY